MSEQATSNSRRRSERRDTVRALALAVAVHAGAALLLWLGSLTWEPERPEIAPSFTLVDAAPFVERREREQVAEEQAQAAQERLQQAREEQAERERERAREQEQQREEAARQALLERQRREQLEREAEREREAQRQRELQRQREEEQRRLEELRELRRQREAAQAEREEQERRLAEIAERREREEAERRAQEEAERLRLAREQAAAEERRGTLREEYVATIQELVRRNWRRPPTTDPGVRCTVRVVQIPGGDIIDQAIASPCNADALTRESILGAVQRVEALPYRGYEEVFEREIVFNFTYDGD